MGLFKKYRTVSKAEYDKDVKLGRGYNVKVSYPSKRKKSGGLF